MKKKTKKIHHCLLCKNKKLKKIFSLGNLYVSNFVKRSEIKKGIRAPLKLLYCSNCELIQLSHIAPQEIMYKRFYWYRSGVTKTMRQGLKDIFTDSLKFVKITKKDLVLDIGANDGTLLKYYKKKSITLGCEPAKNLQKDLKKNCHYRMENFWSFEEFLNIAKKFNLPNPKIITAIGMFYDLEDPNKFIRDAAMTLHDEGIFVAQLMCLKSMVAQNDIGNICHEHLEYYTIKSIRYIFEKVGLKIVDMKFNDVNGGSFRIYCRKYRGGSIKLQNENVKKMMKAFVKRAKSNRKLIMGFLNKRKTEGKTILLYGASTKGNTLLQYYGINSKLIPYAAERSPEKWNKFTVGSGIKIISEKKAREMKPDFFLVTPWGFIDEFKKREIKWRKNGGKFIVPFPKMKVI